jgi:hypothetical protein
MTLATTFDRAIFFVDSSGYLEMDDLVFGGSPRSSTPTSTRGSTEVFSRHRRGLLLGSGYWRLRFMPPRHRCRASQIPAGHVRKERPPDLASQ